MIRATTLANVKIACDPRPLTAEDLAEFFVETAPARDPQSNRRFELAEELLADDEHTKVLLAGHNGSGKSTELTKFAQEHVGRILAVPFSISREATLASITVADLLVLIVERVLSAMQDTGYARRLNDTTLRHVHAWFSEAFEQRQSSRESTLEAGGKAGAEESLLSKLLGLTAWIKTDIRAGARVLRQTITKENRRLAELAHRCGEVLKEATLALAADTPSRQLVVVVEDLDKASIADAERLFFDEPGPLADLPCKAVYTIPIFLTCSPRVQSLDPRFRVHTLPMVKVQGKDGNLDQRGIQTMRDILGKRMDLKLIEPAALDEAIAKTGGVPRDLFAVLTSAASVARQAVERGERQDERISGGDVRYGLNRRKSFLLRGISVAGLPEAYGRITVEQLYERLHEFGDGPIAHAPSDPVNLPLMQAHALIEYNGERWHRVHPLVREYLAANGGQ